jgi:hypothetical protein
MFQAWTPVLVIDPAHPRTGTAGVCQGEPLTREQVAIATAENLDDLALAAEAKAADAAAVAAELAATAKTLAAGAKAARKQADAAAVAVATGTDTGAGPQVWVRFDSDLVAEPVEVSALQALA